LKDKKEQKGPKAQKSRGAFDAQRFSIKRSQDLFEVSKGSAKALQKNMLKGLKEA
jgi:hypothetical protein